MRFPIIDLSSRKCEKIPETNIQICRRGDIFYDFIVEGKKIGFSSEMSISDFIANLKILQSVFRKNNLGGVIVTKVYSYLVYPFAIIPFLSAKGKKENDFARATFSGKSLSKYIGEIEEVFSMVFRINVKMDGESLIRFSNLLSERVKQVKEVWKELQKKVAQNLSKIDDYFLTSDDYFLVSKEIYKNLYFRSNINEILFYTSYYIVMTRKKKNRWVSRIYQLGKEEVAIQLSDFTWCVFRYTPLGIVLIYLSATHSRIGDIMNIPEKLYRLIEKKCFPLRLNDGILIPLYRGKKRWKIRDKFALDELSMEFVIRRKNDLNFAWEKKGENYFFYALIKEDFDTSLNTQEIVFLLPIIKMFAQNFRKILLG